ncbi:MAG: prepilin-type N-terminal cleavage/methylation domain-containing protein [Armatimonadota bacterium]
MDAKRKFGFTIVELIVAFAALAIIAAICFPIFSSVRESAKRSACIGNLCQFSVAFKLYQNDWYDYLPCPGGLSGDYAYWSQSGSGGLNRYIKNQGIESIWCCPLVTEWDGRFAPRSYSMNSYLRMPPDIEYPSCLNLLSGINFKIIEKPEETILLFEGMLLRNSVANQVDYIYRCANWTRVKGYANIDGSGHTIGSGIPWHGKVNNYLYCDGHVKSRPPGKKTTGLLSTEEEMQEWYVIKKDDEE